MGGLWLALEGVGEVGLVVAIRSLRQRSPSLIVGYVALSRVWEQGKDCRDFSCGGGFAGRDCDQQLHQVVINLARSRLYDVDIFSSNRLLDLDAGLANSKFR